MASQEKPKFEFLAGWLCLDFINMMSNHDSQQPLEKLSSYADFIAWAQQANLLSYEEAISKTRLAERFPGKARDLLTQTRSLREIMFRLFSAVVTHQEAPETDIHALNNAISQTYSHLMIRPAHEGFQWDWMSNGTELESVLWPIVHSAAELITSEQLKRVGKCCDEECGWLFFDTSKNRSRRWCSMDSCGNVAKVRRHRKKLAATSDSQLSS